MCMHACLWEHGPGPAATASLGSVKGEMFRPTQTCSFRLLVVVGLTICVLRSPLAVLGDLEVLI